MMLLDLLTENFFNPFHGCKIVKHWELLCSVGKSNNIFLGESDRIMVLKRLKVSKTNIIDLLSENFSINIDSDGDILSLIKEIDILKKLKHKNVMSFEECFIEGEAIFIG